MSKAATFRVLWLCEALARPWVGVHVSFAFLVQMLLIFGGRCNGYFRDIRLKILRLSKFNMLFQLVLPKFLKSELFLCLPKVDHVITSCKGPIVPSTAVLYPAYNSPAA